MGEGVALREGVAWSGYDMAEGEGEQTEIITRIVITDTTTRNDGGRAYTSYETEVHCEVMQNNVLIETSMWTVGRRYSEIADLDKTFSSKSIPTAKLPPKKFGNSLSGSVVEARKKALQKYWDFLLEAEEDRAMINSTLL